MGFFHFPNKIKCEGEFKNDLFEGFGIAYFSNGARFEGEWEKSELKIGAYYYPQGDIYEGEFKNNMREGYGTFYCSDGLIYEGEWKSNYPEGYGIIYSSNGTIYRTEWKNQKLQKTKLFLLSFGTKNNGKNEDIFARILSYNYISLIYSFPFYSIIIRNKITLLLIIILLELII